MWLPRCMDHDCSGQVASGSHWSRRTTICTEVEQQQPPQQPQQQQPQPQQQKEPQQPESRKAGTGPRGHWLGNGNWLGHASAPDALQVVLQKIAQQQNELLEGQANLMSHMERWHRELCQSLEAKPLAFPTFTGVLAEVPDTSPCQQVISADTGEGKSSPHPQHRKRNKAHLHKVPAGPTRVKTATIARAQLAAIIDHPAFDVVMGFIILLNLLAMVVQGQWRGLEAAYNLELRASSSGWPEANKVFEIIEAIFCCVYVLECSLRVCLVGRKYVRNFWNIADMCIVFVNCIDVLVMAPLEADSEQFVVARLARTFRVFRVFRVLKLVRFIAMFTELNVMIKALVSSIPSLLWSMIVVFLMILSGAVLMLHLTTSFLEDHSESLELRRWVYEEFGTSSRAIYAMFESTFTTAWTPKARRLILEVNPALSIFWVIYVVAVNFAVMRVISALFLKQTLAVANLEKERLAMESMKQKDEFARQVRQIFLKGDTSGDGKLSNEEFEAMMLDPEIQAMFKKLELEPDEVDTLFNLLTDEDGMADYEEFLAGAMKMKNSASVLDIVEVLHEQLMVQRSIEKLSKTCKKTLSALVGAGVRVPSCDYGPCNAPGGLSSADLGPCSAGSPRRNRASPRAGSWTSPRGTGSRGSPRSDDLTALCT